MRRDFFNSAVIANSKMDYCPQNVVMYFNKSSFSGVVNLVGRLEPFLKMVGSDMISELHRDCLLNDL